MDTVNKKHSSNERSHVADAASDLLNEGKKYANEIYEQGINKISDAEDNVKQYSDHMLKQVQENPLASVVIAAGIGYLLAKLLK